MPFMLRPEPQKGDGQGKTTQFVALLPREMWGKSLEVTIPNLRIGTDRFRVGFTRARKAFDEGLNGFLHLGIAINPFAQELDQVVIWIGYLQWMLPNAFVAPKGPVLEPFENIKNMDAILDLSVPEFPKEPEWPAAEFIVGKLLAKPTLTNLDNERPTWLDLAHKKLDAAFAAYGWASSWVSS